MSYSLTFLFPESDLVNDGRGKYRLLLSHLGVSSRGEVADDLRHRRWDQFQIPSAVDGIYLIGSDTVRQSLLDAIPRDDTCNEVGESTLESDKQVEDRDL